MIEDLFSAIIKLFKKKELQSKNIKNDYINEEEQKVNTDDIIEHHEVLYSDKPNIMHRSQSVTHKMLFTDVKSVESDIDRIDKEKTSENGNIEKRVDLLLSKKKKNIKTSTHRKPANVIYVVSKPQPGQVKGDWAVRSHYKIFSHHRTKQAAIKQARKIALERDATVLVQNMDGTFSNGFKPREKK